MKLTAGKADCKKKEFKETEQRLALPWSSDSRWEEKLVARGGGCEMKGQLRTDCQSSEDVMTKVKLTVKHSNILIRIAATKQTCEKTKEETIQQTDCALLMCPIKNDREDSLFGPRRSLRSWRRQPSGLGQVGKLEGLGVEGRVGITSHPAVQAQFQLLHTSGE